MGGAAAGIQKSAAHFDGQHSGGAVDASPRCDAGPSALSAAPNSSVGNQERQEGKSLASGKESKSMPASRKEMPESALPQPGSLDELVAEIRARLQDKGLTDISEGEVAELQALMGRYVSRESDWLRYALYDEHRYTRNLVDEGNGKYNLILMAWGPNHRSPIHDHSGSHCIYKMLAGTLVETRYAEPTAAESAAGAPMRIACETTLERDSAGYIRDGLGLHRVGNPSASVRAASLHLYTPPIRTCQTFCEETSAARACGKMVFHSRDGQLLQNGGASASAGGNSVNADPCADPCATSSTSSSKPAVGSCNSQ